MNQLAARSQFRNLWDAEFKIFSQWGEDGIIFFICDRLDIWRPRMLEIGAGDFTECNSRFVAQELAGQVVVVDSDRSLATNVTNRPDAWRGTVLALTEWVTPDSAADLLLRTQRLIGYVDVLSLDIDGNDYWVLESMPLETVKVLVVEYNPLFGSELAVTVPRTDSFSRYDAHESSLYYGASLRAFIGLATDRGFDFVGTNRVGNNAFFVKSSLSRSLGIPLPDVSHLDRFVDWPIRDGRSEDGSLSLLTGLARIESMADMPLVNLMDGSQVTVAIAAGVK